jgi:hypothetical protein
MRARVEWKRKISKHGTKLGIGLPEEALNALGWTHGDTIIIALTDHTLELKKK